MTVSDALSLGDLPDGDEIAQRLEDEAVAQAFDKNIEDRDRRIAASVGMTYEDILELPEAARARLMSAKGLSEAERGNKEFHEIPKDLGGIDRSKQGMEQYAHSLSGDDAKQYVYLCPPPVQEVIDGVRGTYTPEPRMVPRVQMEQKLAQGWTLYPRHPFLPEPEYPCALDLSIISGLGGRPCEYMGRTPGEVEMHMRVTHPAEYSSRERHLERERQERQIAAMESQATLMRQMLERGIAPPVGV